MGGCQYFGGGGGGVLYEPPPPPPPKDPPLGSPKLPASCIPRGLALGVASCTQCPPFCPLYPPTLRNNTPPLSVPPPPLFPPPQLALRGPPGPMGYTGRPGPMVGISVPVEFGVQGGSWGGGDTVWGWGGGEGCGMGGVLGVSGCVWGGTPMIAPPLLLAGTARQHRHEGGVRRLRPPGEPHG